MEGLLLILGIICSLQIGCHGGTSPTVRVNDNMEIKVGRSATLECFGSDPTLNFYVSNRPSWSYVNMKGEVIPISEGFYCVDGHNCMEKHYSIHHEERGPEYVFALTIAAVNNADDGYYKCSLVNMQETVLDSKQLKLTVINRVERVMLEVVGVKGAKSTTPLTVGDPSIKITPGTYTVRCTASGSNPSPVMELKYNEQTPYVSIMSTKDAMGERVKYTGSYELSVDITASAGLEQALVCDANIPNRQYNTKTAGLKLQVSVEKPIFSCENVTASVGNKYRQLKCDLSAKGSDHLTCDKVHWVIGDDLQSIPDSTGNQKVKDSLLGTVEMDCEPTTTGMKTSLTIYTITDESFTVVYYVEYGIGEGAHRHPVNFHFTEISGASIITPLSLLLCVVTSLLARHLAKL